MELTDLKFDFYTAAGKVGPPENDPKMNAVRVTHEPSGASVTVQGNGLQAILKQIALDALVKIVEPNPFRDPGT